MADGRRRPGQRADSSTPFDKGSRRSRQRHRCSGRDRPHCLSANARAAHPLAAVLFPGATTGRRSDRIMAGYPVHLPANPWHGHRMLRRANMQPSATSGHSVRNADFALPNGLSQRCICAQLSELCVALPTGGRILESVELRWIIRFQETDLPHPEQSRRHAVGQPGRVLGMVKRSERI